MSDSEVAKSCGGLNAMVETLRADIVAAGHEAIRRYSAEKVAFAQLPARIREIDAYIISQTESEWQSKYGVLPEKVDIMGITMTEESKQIYSSLM